MLELLTLDYDRRIAAFCVTAKTTYAWFLDKTEGAEENLEIQRQIIRGSKAYATLREDLKRGCVLPPLVLSVRDVETPSTDGFEAFLRNKAAVASYLETLRDRLLRITSNGVFIIDGLQRTNALRQVRQALEGAALETFNQSFIRFEIWLSIPFSALAYRMLLLNAGQKPMSMKHQVEILSRHLLDDLEGIPGIDLFVTADGRRRTRGGQFQLAKIAQAFQAWLQGSPNIDVSNVVMQELLAESAIETLGKSVGKRASATAPDSFRRLMEWIVDVDCNLPNDLDFLGAETVLQGISAAVGAAERNELLRERVMQQLPVLAKELRDHPNEDPLGIGFFKQVRRGFDPGRRNVGVATRELVFQAFQEYFVADGTKPMGDCWRFAATMSKA